MLRREVESGYVKPRGDEERADQYTCAHCHGSWPYKQQCADCFRAAEANE
jgi:hypothetical protein